MDLTYLLIVYTTVLRIELISAFLLENNNYFMKLLGTELLGIIIEELSGSY